MSRRAFTLVEIMVVMLIFMGLFAAVLTVVATQDRSWRAAEEKLNLQRQVRKAMDKIVPLLRQTRPEWITISADAGTSKKILFYKPVYDEVARTVSPGAFVIFKLDPADIHRLVKKDSDLGAAFAGVSQNIKSISFGGGCAGCASYNCDLVSADCPVVRINIEAEDETGYSLSTDVSLRNFEIATAGIPEPPPEGEF
jgi:type II secretory pathway pseudopilin PulG